MIELVATVIITVSSVLLFGYWFRYTCLLILSAKTTRDFAGQVATANQLGFLQVQLELRDNPADLGRLCDSLNRDYAILTRLLQQTSASSVEGSSIEKRMLEINYRLTRAWYRTSSQFSAAAAQRALEEMSMVVAHFANIMGEQAASAAAA
jgi:Skp family chaperone for outer membrane proteins